MGEAYNWVVSICLKLRVGNPGWSIAKSKSTIRYKRKSEELSSAKMSLQWTLVATFLYTEIAVVIILLLPFISPTRWNAIFQSNAIKTFKSTSHYYFRFSVGILFLLFVDAIRSVRHYTAPLEAEHGHHDGPLA